MNPHRNRSLTATFEVRSPIPLGFLPRNRGPEVQSKSPHRIPSGSEAAANLLNQAPAVQLNGDPSRVADQCAVRRAEIAGIKAKTQAERAEIAILKAKFQAERAAHIAVLINSAIDEGRVPFRDREQWTTRFNRDFLGTRAALQNTAPADPPDPAGFASSVERRVQAGQKLGTAVVEAVRQNPNGYRAWLRAGSRPALPTSPR